MALAVHIMHGCGSNNEIPPQLQPMKAKVHKAIITVIVAAKDIIHAIHH